MNALAAWQHRAIVRRLSAGSSQIAGQSALALSVAILLAIIGLAMAGYLVAVR